MGKKKFPVRQPRYAAGIRLQEPRGAASRTWWAKRWMETLAEKDLAGRFGRGRAYAMSGQVISVRLCGTVVEADVVGVRPEPYQVCLRFRAPSGEARARLVARLVAEPMLLARLVAGDLPTEVESMFRAEGFYLFPGGKLGEGVYDVTTSCTCPDYANPCKHSFAALLVLGEEISRRPALLLELRGIALVELCGEVP